jgi:hypothetical protein
MPAPGNLTLTALLALTKQALGGRTGGLMTDSWYIDRINMAYARVASFQGLVMAPGMRRPQFRVLRFFELYREDDRTIRTTDVTDSNFITPAFAKPVVYVDSVFDLTNDRMLRRKAIRHMNRLNPAQAGQPTQWCPTGRNAASGYLVHPVPAVAADEVLVREKTYRYPDALTSALDDTPIIPSAWHAAIWRAAAAEAAELADWPEKAAEMEQKFMSFLAERRSPVEEAGAAGGRRHFTVGGAL